MGGPAQPGRDVPRIEVADILRDHAGSLPLSAEQARVVRALAACRTAQLGGHLERCDHCGYSRPAYNSCRNRHCPKCQVLEQELWAEAQAKSLLPAPYFHVVFTVPAALHQLFRRDSRTCLGLLFEAVAQTLAETAGRRLGARLGFTAVLHTWNQKLLYHPHLHCIVSGGGLSADATRWVGCRDGFLLPVRILRIVFRGKFLSKLERALEEGRLDFAPLRGRELLREAARQTWVVYAKRPLAGPEQVVRYVSRYTHRIAISNSRLRAYDGSEVTFLWRDRADNNARRDLTLSGREFARRFLLHVLPRGFVRIRHYGLLSNRTRHSDLEQCQRLLGALNSPGRDTTFPGTDDWVDRYRRIFQADPLLCPVCREGRLTIHLPLVPAPTLSRPPPEAGARS